jgi:hypothetical protein
MAAVAAFRPIPTPAPHYAVQVGSPAAHAYAARPVNLSPAPAPMRAAVGVSVGSAGASRPLASVSIARPASSAAPRQQPSVQSMGAQGAHAQVTRRH